jgi:hypothetical protein
MHPPVNLSQQNYDISVAKIESVVEQDSIGNIVGKLSKYPSVNYTGYDDFTWQ